MAFDQKTRNLLQRTVTACRRALDREFTAQLQELYGIQPDGTITPCASLEHLGDEELAVARLLRERINHLEGGSDAEALTRTAAKPEHIARVIREQAFTVLNRLAALRLCEERLLVLECVRQGANSEGFKLFMSSAGNALGETHEAYRIYLHCLFDELAIDLGVLFDRFGPLALLFPRHDALTEVLSELNGTGKAAEREEIPPEQFAQIWQADETIGWIYQYYNDETERKKMREQSAAPRNSRELAVRNQFFTPRYVVEFLTDNTLGRIWYEMSGGRTVLKEKCRYLVRRPSEVFLAGTAEVYRELFSRKDSADDMTPAKWVAEAFAGQLQNLTENASDSDTRWVGAAIRPADFENLTGEPCKPFEEHRLSRLSSAIIEGRETADSQNLVLVWASLSDFIRCDGSRGYSAPHWEKLWAHFRKLAQQSVVENLSQAELLKQPVFIPHRPLKDPRTIFMLDPACGSMHFGLYAFDLFEVIYTEAWDHHPELLQDLRAELSTFNSQPSTPEEARSAFLRLVPRLIIEHNIHGIDIDPRCVQMAGLALWLRAQNAWKAMDLKPAERPRITRSNIVCAEPMPGEKELLREFVEKEFPTAERGVFLQLLVTIFDKMQLAGEAGSLLKIEEEIRSAIADAKQLWKETPKAKQSNLFPQTGQLEQKEIKLDVSGITDEQFWGRVEERIYAALREYAEQAENGGGFQRRLFAEDAARGFAFIDVCRKRYDVALMNPPFGSPAESFADGKEQYPNSGRDIYAMFVERMGAIVGESGLVGAILPRTGLFIGTMVNLRKECYLRSAPLRLLVDLGKDVLDGATIRTACYVMGESHIGAVPCLRIGNIEDREQKLLRILAALCSGDCHEDLFLRKRDYFLALPASAIAYWIPEAIALRLPMLATMDAIADIRQGIATGDNFRFLRLLCELPTKRSGFRFYSKGGEPVPFISNESLYVRAFDACAEMKANAAQEYGSASRTIKNEETFGVSGITYSQVNDACLKFRIHPIDAIYDMKGPVLFPRDGVDRKALLGFLNSAAVEDFMRMMTDGRQWHVSALKSVPAPAFTKEKSARLCQLCVAASGLRLVDCANDETGHYFSFARFAKHLEVDQMALDRVLNEIEDEVWDTFGASRDEIASFQRQRQLFLERTISAPETQRQDVSEIVKLAFGFTFGRWDMRYATGEQAAPELPDPFAPLPVCPPGQLQNAQGLPARPEDVPATYPITIQWDGIILDDPTHPVDIERCVREVIEEIWKDRANAIEQEACEILGFNSLRDYFRRPAGFFADHLKRYSKSRRQAPIYWPLATASGSYTLWIYYHRLDDQTLYKCIQQFIDPKLADVEKELTKLRTVIAANEGSDKDRKRLEELEDLRRELIELRTELELWAPKWKPNLNDGVLITASPLWKLLRLPKWQKDLKACWQELERGDYDWSHLAYTLWPDRVREKCKSDRSLAIAHGLEDLCAVKAPVKKVKKGKAKKTSVEAELITE